jgi:tRNA(adenine34) deaminase
MNDEFYMLIAVKEAEKAALKGEVPVGAVIVHNEKVVSKAHNLRISKNSSVAHAEILAIEKASRKTGDWRLEGMTLFVTCEPCIMCAGAVIHSRLKKVVYGCREPKMGAVESVYNVFNCDNLHHKPEIYGRVLEKECRKLLQDFFKRVRTDKRR